MGLISKSKSEITIITTHSQTLRFNFSQSDHTVGYPLYIVIDSPVGTHYIRIIPYFEIVYRNFFISTKEMQIA